MNNCTDCVYGEAWNSSIVKAGVYSCHAPVPASIRKGKIPANSWAMSAKDWKAENWKCEAWKGKDETGTTKPF